MIRRTSILMLTAATLFGCASQKPAQTSYETVSENLTRNTRTARSLHDQALKLLDEKKYTDAEAMLKKALDADVYFGPAHNNLGLVYYHEHKYYLAAWEFQYAIKLMPHNPEPRNNLGMVFEIANRLDEAIDSYTDALKIQPDNPEVIGNLARARLRRNDKDPQARPLLQQIIEKDTRPDWVNWAKEKLALMPTGNP